jgi:hypothetical protein
VGRRGAPADGVGAACGRAGGDLLAVDVEEDLECALGGAAVGRAGGALQLHARVGDPQRLDEAHVDGARERADEQVEHWPRHAQPLAQAPAARSVRLCQLQSILGGTRSGRDAEPDERRFRADHP